MEESKSYQENPNVKLTEKQFKNLTVSLEVNENPQGCEYVIVSSDDMGTPGKLNTFVFDKLGIKEEIEKLELESDLKRDGWKKYSKIHSEIQNKFYNIYFIVTVSGKDPKLLLGENLRKGLIDIFLTVEEKSKIWLPLMATGTSRLPKVLSAEITIDVISDLIKEGITQNRNAEITVALPSDISDKEKLEITKIFDEKLKINKEAIRQEKIEETDYSDSSISEIKNKILSAKDNNFWLIGLHPDLQFRQLSEGGIDIGYVTGYDYLTRDYSNDHIGLLNELEQNDLVLGYFTDEEKKIRCLFEIEIIHSEDDKSSTEFQLLYLINENIRLDDIINLSDSPDLFEQIKKNNQPISKLTFNQFIEIINTTELGPIEKTSIRPPKKEVVPTHRDSPAVVDKLNRKPLADSLCTEIKEIWDLDDPNNLESDKLFTVHVQGPWGAGKSTFLNLIEQNLTMKDEKGEEPWIVIKYNAWKNQHIDPPWWTLIESIYKQAADKVTNKGKFRWNEWWRRIKIGNRHYLIIAGVILLLTILLSFILIPAVFPSDDIEISKKIEKVGDEVKHIVTTTTESTKNDKSLLEKFAIVITLISGLFFTFRSLHSSIKSTLLPGAISSVKSFIDLSKDPLEKIKKHYADIVKSVGKKSVAVFVDDLDRCNPKYTVEFLEGLLTLFKEPKVLYIIAADKKWVANCFEIQYEKFTKNYHQKGTTLGYHFIQKAFQLSVKLPEIKDPDIQKYWRYILKTEKEQPEKIEEKRVQTEEKFKNLQTEEQIYNEVKKLSKQEGFSNPIVLSTAVNKFSEPEIAAKTEQHILEDFSCYLEPNPRAIKRMANYYNLFRNSLLLEGKIIERTYIVRWLVLSQRWPLLSEELEKDSSLFKKNITSIKNENLKNLISRQEVQFIIKGKKEEKKPLTKEIIDKLIGL